MSKLIAPKRKPQEFGFKPGDSHLVGNAITKTVKAFSFEGKLLWEKPCLFDGTHSNWRRGQGDTPPGLFKLGQIYNDVARLGSLAPRYDRTLAAFGWITWDLIDCEGNEDNNGRAGICLHGGGSALGWPGAWKPYQKLVPTWGCPRMHNADLRDFVLPLDKTGTVFFSVHQDES
jgi:hypothetical protein